MSAQIRWLPLIWDIWRGKTRILIPTYRSPNGVKEMAAAVLEYDRNGICPASAGVRLIPKVQQRRQVELSGARIFGANSHPRMDAPIYVTPHMQ
jgi:hypothetical protein